MALLVNFKTKIVLFVVEENSLYVTSGDWDLGYMLPEQLKLSNIPIPGHVRHWINIKKVSNLILVWAKQFMVMT